MSNNQLGDANELARRFVACKGWQYRRGMVLSDGTMVVRVAANGQPVVAGGISRGGCALSETLPDLSDPATIGCILALVRTAWGNDSVCVYMYGRAWNVMASGSITEHFGATEIEALLAALEAAP